MSEKHKEEFNKSQKNEQINKNKSINGQNQAADLFEEDSQTCTTKLKKKIDQLTDRAANFLQCTRVFSKERLEELKTIAKNQSEDTMQNQSTKSVPSNISKMSTKQDLKNSDKSSDGYNKWHWKQLPLKNYGMNMVNKFQKRYNEDYSQAYSERSKRFKRTFEQVTMEREEEYQRKAKTFWGQLKRLLFCHGGTYLDEIQDINSTTESIQNLECSYISRKREPNIQINGRQSNNNIFLSQSLVLNDEPPVQINFPINKKRKIRTNVKLVNENGETFNQKDKESEQKENGNMRRTGDEFRFNTKAQQQKREVQQRPEYLYQYDDKKQEQIKNMSQGSNQIQVNNKYKNGEQMEGQNNFLDIQTLNVNRQNVHVNNSSKDHKKADQINENSNWSQYGNGNQNNYQGDESYNYEINGNQEVNRNSMNSSQISFTSGFGPNLAMKKSKKNRRPIISKTEGIPGQAEFESQIKQASINNWKSNTTSLSNTIRHQKINDNMNGDEIEGGDGQQQQQGYEMERQLSRKKKNKRKANLMVVQNHNIQEEIQFEDL